MQTSACKIGERDSNSKGGYTTHMRGWNGKKKKWGLSKKWDRGCMKDELWKYFDTLYFDYP